MSMHADNEIIRSYLSGDNSSFELLLNKYKNRVFSFIYSKINDRELADDFFQETFIKVIKTLKKGKYREEGRFLSWVMRIANNLIIDHYRSKKRIPKYESCNSEFDIFYKISETSKNTS